MSGVLEYSRNSMLSSVAPRAPVVNAPTISCVTEICEEPSTGCPKLLTRNPVRRAAAGVAVAVAAAPARTLLTARSSNAYCLPLSSSVTLTERSSARLVPESEPSGTSVQAVSGSTLEPAE